jgi:hypothetical protein
MSELPSPPALSELDTGSSKVSGPRDLVAGRTCAGRRRRWLNVGRVWLVPLAKCRLIASDAPAELHCGQGDLATPPRSRLQPGLPVNRRIPFGRIRNTSPPVDVWSVRRMRRVERNLGCGARRAVGRAVVFTDGTDRDHRHGRRAGWRGRRWSRPVALQRAPGLCRYVTYRDHR